MNDILVVGGGPAGMMAAYSAAKAGARVWLAEKNDKLGKKLFITGKGRCNITNACETQDFFANVVKNPKFLMSSIYGFSGNDLIDLFAKNGLRTKVERGDRVFPISDRSSDVIKILSRLLDEAGVDIMLNTEVTSIEKISNNKFEVEIDSAKGLYDVVIMATGGVSYPLTGSTGDGYKFANALGHKTISPTAALIPLEDEHNICAKMQGLTLKNVAFSLYQNNKEIYSEQGEVLFTHFGLSGPVVLSASSYINYTKDASNLYCTIDFKPALNEEKLEARLLRDFAENQNKQLKTYMSELLPSKIINSFLSESRLDEKMQINQISKETRHQLISALKCFKIKIAGPRPISEAIVTAGGVDVKQVNPSTMESKLVSGLYFAGELLDVSAQTGGFNLQIAFSTGFLAGAQAAEKQSAE